MQVDGDWFCEVSYYALAKESIPERALLDVAKERDALKEELYKLKASLQSGSMGP